MYYLPVFKVTAANEAECAGDGRTPPPRATGTGLRLHMGGLGHRPPDGSLCHQSAGGFPVLALAVCFAVPSSHAYSLLFRDMSLRSSVWAAAARMRTTSGLSRGMALSWES